MAAGRIREAAGASAPLKGSDSLETSHSWGPSMDPFPRPNWPKKKKTKNKTQTECLDGGMRGIDRTAPLPSPFAAPINLDGGRHLKGPWGTPRRERSCSEGSRPFHVKGVLEKGFSRMNYQPIRDSALIIAIAVKKSRRCKHKRGHSYISQKKDYYAQAEKKMLSQENVIREKSPPEFFCFQRKTVTAGKPSSSMGYF